jgi:hypothetical protein
MHMMVYMPSNKVMAHMSDVMMYVRHDVAKDNVAIKHLLYLSYECEIPTIFTVNLTIFVVKLVCRCHT